MSANKPPEVTPPCCEVWIRLAPLFRWCVFGDWPHLRSMPSLDRWRVNFCPSCGAPRRDAVEVDG